MNPALDPSARRALPAGLAFEFTRDGGSRQLTARNRQRHATLPDAGGAGQQKRRRQRVTRNRTRQQCQQTPMAITERRNLEPGTGTPGYASLLPLPNTFAQNPRFFGSSGFGLAGGGGGAGAASAVCAVGCGAAVSVGDVDRPGEMRLASALNGFVRILRWIGHDSVGSVPATKYSV